MRSENEMSVLVNRAEKSMLDVMEKNRKYKLREICKLSGVNYATANVYMKMFRELEWVKYDRMTSLYQIDENLDYYTNETDSAVIKKASGLKPTYPRGFEPRAKMDGEMKVTMWTPEELAEQERRANKHLPYLEFKKGVLKRNENYNPASHTR